MMQETIPMAKRRVLSVAIRLPRVPPVIRPQPIRMEQLVPWIDGATTAGPPHLTGVTAGQTAAAL